MIAIKGIIVTEAMTDAGDQMAADCMDAHIQRSLGGIGRCGKFDPLNFPHNTDLLKKYLDDEICSVEAIYIAMQRAKGE